jgi:hypothetical protein
VPGCANPQIDVPRSNAGAIRAWEAPLVLRLWHLASLDAPTVAVIWSWGLAWAVHVQLPAWAPILLALAGWAVYIGDRLLDARAGMLSPPQHVLRDRHYFHWRHRYILAPLGLLAALAGAGIAVTKLPAGARVPDSAIAAATLAYFSGVHSRKKLPPLMKRLLAPFCSKAFLIGVLFTVGCLLPVWSQAGATAASISADRLLAIPGAFFAVLAWLNCRAIGRWESGAADLRSRQLQSIAGLVGMAGLVLSLLLLRTEPRPAILIATGAVSALLLGLLDRLRSRLTPLAVRAGADLVLLTPALLLVFAYFRL